MKPRFACLAILALALLAGVPVRGDTLFLRGGEKLIGHVLSESAAMVVFESQTLGRIEVPRERIDRVAVEPSQLDGVAVVPAPANPPAVAVLTPTDRFVPWDNATPDGDTHDWIQLKSGEWLKGRMKSLQNDEIEFDSDKLERQTFDWKDIYTVRLPRLSGVRFDTFGQATGRVLVTTNTVLVAGGTTNAYPRSELISIAPAGKRERSKWSGDISAGVSLHRGNTRQVDYNAQVQVDRRTPSTHFSLDYLGNLSKVDQQETANSHRATAQFDYFLSSRLFLLVPLIEYYRDPLQNLEHRLTVGGGVGYDFVRTARTEWNITAGPAYQENGYTSVSRDERERRGAAALVLGSKFQLDLTSRFELSSDFRAQITRKEVGQTTFHSQTKLEYKVHKRLSLNTSFVWDRISVPETDAQGVTPQRDDFRLITGLGINF